MRSKMYLGDNLEIMGRMGSASVALIYLDPPFNSKRDYNIYLEQTTNEKVNKQDRAIEVAFEDTWKFNQEVFDELKTSTKMGRAADFLRFLHGCLGNSSLMSYMCYMTPRLWEMRRILTDEGSIYLHCDPSASHYLKILMDGIFGPENFRNEIVWCYKRWTLKSNIIPRLHDVILSYGKTKNTLFNNIMIPNDKPNTSQYVSAKDKNGKTIVAKDPNGIPIKRNIATEIEVGDWWDIPIISPNGKERLGYPTQKPKKLLERIILASSNKGDIVFDPFSGSGTTLEVAKKLERDFVGIDINGDAIILQKNRLEKNLNLLPQRNYDLEDGPSDLEGAIRLATQTDKSRFGFEKWALYKLGFISRTCPGKGIDGFCIFMTETASLNDGRDTNKIIGEVKSDEKISVNAVGQLTRYLGETNAPLGLLIGLYDNARIKEECKKQGYVTIDGIKYQKIQYISIETLFRDEREHNDGEKSIKLPPRRDINKPKEIILNTEPDLPSIIEIDNKTTPLLFD